MLEIGGTFIAAFAMQRTQSYAGPMWTSPFNTTDVQAMGRELAILILSHLSEASRHSGKKYQGKADKVLVRAEHRIVDYKKSHTVNWYQRSRAANAFLWALKDGGCPEDYANELTQWFVLRL